jgi:NAD(P)-dependent dehydrogenase (short-subunit alcohol dehydrogenase family)
MDHHEDADRLANPIRATLKGIFDLRPARRAGRPRLRAGERVDGLTALVTGASSGLGFATAVDLARRGATVLMADCRGLPQAQERARRMCGENRFAPLDVDLSDLDSIERLCDELVRREARLDRVILNAAIVPAEIRTTPQGLNELFVVNYLSSFLLLRRLLRAGVVENPVFAPPGRPRARRPRIIFVSSEAHRWGADLDLTDIAKTPTYSLGKVVAVYGYYKLMTTTLAQELDRRLNPPGQLNVPVLSLCPGAMNTNITREAPPLVRPLIRLVMRLFFQDPFGADEPVIYLACSEELETRTGVYLHQMVRKAVDARASDPEAGRALWERSEALLAELGHG